MHASRGVALVKIISFEDVCDELTARIRGRKYIYVGLIGTEQLSQSIFSLIW